jgi:peptidoglycan hydrolase-like protein with peptidoglycan-binding domain
LQVFLNTFTSSTVPISGVFDLTSERAVRQFQQEHKSEILDPWGLTRPSGYVYYTTQKKVNELYCDKKVTFPLSSEQTAEVNQFRFASVPSISVPTHNPVMPAKKEDSDVISALPKPQTNKPFIDVHNLPNRLADNNGTAVSSSARNKEQTGSSFFARLTGWFKQYSLSDIWTWRSAVANEE